jgi:transcriptional regulator with XRE-family HTH domain
MAFSENLRTARKVKNLSQEQLAELLSVSRQAISKWELDDGYPETEKLMQLAEILGVTLDYLLLDRPDTKAGAADHVPQGDRKITIRSYDGNRMSACNEFAIVKLGRLMGKRSPKCLLSGKEGGIGVWGGNTILGWYASLEDAQKELAEIYQAMQGGEASYQLKYFANVNGFFNPRIVKNDEPV